MTDMKWGAFDLNLLIVFDAVMQEGSVTRAGNRLGLSQPALSHALTRLRHMLNDELFVRTPKGMIPTPRAEQLALPVRRALDELQHSLEPAEFDPSKATRRFQIAVDNYASVVLVGLVASHILKIAPDVTLEFRPSGTLNLSDELDRDGIDLAIGTFAGQGERFSLRPLLQDEFVLVLRKDHPAAAGGAISIERLAAFSFLEISSAHDPTDLIDQALERLKLSRRIGLSAPFLSAVRILLASDMVSIFRRRVAEELVRYRALAILPLPYQSATIETAMIWHRRFDHQPAHRWLREVIGEICATLAAPPR